MPRKSWMEAKIKLYVIRRMGNNKHKVVHIKDEDVMVFILETNI